MQQYELVEENLFVKKISENEYDFIQVIDIRADGDEYKYLVIGAKTDFRWNTAEDLLKYSEGKLTEAEVHYPFAVCLYLFRDLEIGNEDWNKVFKGMHSVKKFLLEEYDIDYTALLAE